MDGELGNPSSVPRPEKVHFFDGQASFSYSFPRGRDLEIPFFKKDGLQGGLVISWGEGGFSFRKSVSLTVFPQAAILLNQERIGVVDGTPAERWDRVVVFAGHPQRVPRRLLFLGARPIPEIRKEGLTVEQALVVQRSFEAALRQLGEGIMAQFFYDRLFVLNPDLKDLFKGPFEERKKSS